MHDELLQALIQHGADHARLVHHATFAQNGALVLKYAPLAAKEAARVGAHREAAAHLKAALLYGDSLSKPARAQILEHMPWNAAWRMRQPRRSTPRKKQSHCGATWGTGKRSPAC